MLFAPWDVDGPDEVVREYVRACMEPVWSGLIRSCVRTGVNEGCAPHELVWQRTETTITTVDTETGDETDNTVAGWTLSKVKDIDPASLRSIWVNGLEEFDGYALTYPNTDLPRDKCFHFATGVRFGNYWGEGRLVAAYDPWYQYRILTALYMRFMARRTTPAVHVEFPAGESSDGTSNAETARAIATGFQSDATSAWTQSQEGADAAKWAINLIESGTVSSVPSAFLAGRKDMERRMMIALLTPEKILNGDAGAFALAETHKDIWITGVEGTFAEIIEAVNKQIIPRIVRYTFGDVPIPRIVPAGMSDSSRQYLGGLFTELVKSGKVTVDADAIAERVGVPTIVGESAQTEGEELKDDLRAVAHRLAEDLQVARLSMAARL